MVYIVFIYLVILLLYVRKNYSNISSYIIALYAFSLFFSISLYNSNSNYRDPSFIASIVFCLVLLFYFIPFFKKNINIEVESNFLFLKRFSIVGYGLSTVLILGSILLFSKIEEAFVYGLVESRQAMYKREEIFISYTALEHIGHSTLKWLSGLSYTALIMYFYAFTFINKRTLLKVLLIFSSLSASYLGLLNGGRTNLIYWILSFIFCLILFWPYFSPRNKRVVYIISAFFLSVLVSYFIFISVGRAELVTDGETGEFLKSYAGQSYLNFCHFYENIDFHTYSLYRILPLTSNLLFGRFNLSEYRDFIYANSQMDIGVFYTFLGDLFVDIGLLGMFIYSFIYYHIAKRVMRRDFFKLSNLLIFGICYQIPLHGVFYYSLWRMESTVCVVITILIANYLTLNKSQI